MPMTDPKPFHDPLMQEMSLRSDINGREYGLRIRLPQNYGQGGQRYPVLLLMDGEVTFYMACGIAPLEAVWSQAPLTSVSQLVPEVIIAAVFLPGDPPDPFRRNFEYMPPVTEDEYPPALAAYLDRIRAMIGHGPKFGGASDFLDIVRDEILPAIDANYRTDNRIRMLAGGSASGCFTAFALLKQPELFTDYVIVNPGPAADIFRMEAALAEIRDDLPARVLLTVGEHEVTDPLTIFSNTVRLAEALNGRNYPSLQLETWVVPGATHAQAFAPSLARALVRLGGL